MVLIVKVALPGVASRRKRLAEGVGSAHTSVVTDPVFETGAASLYLPAFLRSG